VRGVDAAAASAAGSRPDGVVARAAFPKGSPAMSARDELADV
jgi:hypothetical protein